MRLARLHLDADHSTCNDCITDGDQNYDTTNDAPSAGGTLYPAEQYSACPKAVTGLSYDWDGTNTLVNSMGANGGANQPIGLV